ncbi:hypothetical protein [Sphingomonas sp.]|uniref:hypothetical protein n=1 Tax=Sphingomonas sp. TaxID=28214 RepID=UPI0035C7A016
MSFIGDAMKTIESVVLLRSKVDLLDKELAATNEEVRRVIGTIIQIDRRLVRLETIEELRTGARPLPRIEGQS